jgi:hypothetical protein
VCALLGHHREADSWAVQQGRCVSKPKFQGWGTRDKVLFPDVDSFRVVGVLDVGARGTVSACAAACMQYVCSCTQLQTCYVSTFTNTLLLHVSWLDWLGCGF